jgi:hypothetical protein
MNFKVLTLAAAAVSMVMTTATAAPGAATATRSRLAVPPAKAAGSPGAAQVVFADGQRALVLRQGASPEVVPLAPAGTSPAGLSVVLGGGGRTYEVPFDALPFLGHGLDPSLFDATALASRESGGKIPVVVRYRRPGAPGLPGITITAPGRGRAGEIRTAAGYLTASSAAVFGAALARQYAADRNRGSYGTDGMFAGGVSVSLAGDATAAAASPQSTKHTLTITGTNLSGQPDTGDVVIVFNVDNGKLNSTLAPLNFVNGIAKVSVPAGHYSAIAGYITLEPGGNSLDVTDAHLDVLPQFTVTANTTVHTSAKAATSRVVMVTPRPARAESSDFGILRTSAAGPPSQAFVSALRATIWVNPTGNKPAVGTLTGYAAQQLASPAGLATPYQYEVNYTDPPGIIPPQTWYVRPDSLATVTDIFYQDVFSSGQWYMYGTERDVLPDGASYINPYPSPISLQARQIRYIGGNAPQTTWGDYYDVREANGDYVLNGDSEDWYTAHPGEQQTDIWNQYPLHPGPDVSTDPQSPYNLMLPSASREGDTLTVSVTPFDDNQPGHSGVGTTGFTGARTSGTYQIDQNGTRIASGSVPIGPSGSGAFTTQATLSPAASTIRFELDMKQTGSTFPLSTASTTVWTWRSSHEAGDKLPQGWYCDDATSSQNCRVEPMMTLLYHVHDMALNGTTAPGRQVMDVNVGHIQLAGPSAITGATVQFSLNDGATWHDALMIRLGPGLYRAVYNAPAGAYVTLRTTATAAAGGSIAETITRGYQIAS